MRIKRVHFTSTSATSVVNYIILLTSKLLKMICLTFAMDNSIKNMFFLQIQIMTQPSTYYFQSDLKNGVSHSINRPDMPLLNVIFYYGMN